MDDLEQALLSDILDYYAHDTGDLAITLFTPPIMKETENLMRRRCGYG